MLERDYELERIHALIDRVARGGDGFLAIEAVAGLGKTTLLEHARTRAAAAGVRALMARASELERDYAFGIARQWLEPELVAADASARTRLLSGAAALAEPVLLGTGLDGREPEISPRVLHSLYWLLANMSERQPTVLILDDAQWADEPSLRFMNFIVSRLEGAAMAILFAARPVEAYDAGMLLSRLLGDPGCEVLRPATLSESAAAELLGERLGQPPEQRFRDAVQEAAGGNPFYLKEIGETLARDGIDPTDDHAAEVAQLRPQTLARAILSRLSAEARVAARALAVLDAPSELRLVAAVAAVPVDVVARAAEELVSSGVIDDARPLRFVHPIVRGAMLAGVSRAERSELHERAAAELRALGAGAERVAIHLLELEPRGDQDVVETLAEGARLAAARGAPEVAVRLLRRAMAEPPAPEKEAKLLFSLGMAENESDLPEASGHLFQAAELASDPVDRGRALVVAGWAGGINARPVGGLPLIEEAIDALGDRDRELTLSLEATAMMVGFLTEGDSGRETMAERAARFGDLRGETPGEAVLLAGLARYEMDRGAPADVVAALAERASGCPGTLVGAGPNWTWLLNCAIALIQTERLDFAQRLLEDAVARARELGSATGFGIASANLAGVALRRGDLRRAEADARAALASGGARAWYRTGATTRLIESLVRQGRVDEAQSAYDSTGFGEQIPEFRPATPILIARGQLRWAQGEIERAEADLSDALRRISRHAAPNAVGLDARLLVTLIHHATGERARAEEEAAEALSRARAWGAPGALGDALRVQGVVRGGQEGIEMLSKAVEILAGSSHVLTHATALIDLGAAIRRGGSRAAARKHLREGLALAEWGGAAPLWELARQELAATGVRVPRADARHRLTPSEQRISQMAADGATNPQIAQALFVTVKTVESHLANAYRKLEISSRRELPAALARQATA